MAHATGFELDPNLPWQGFRPRDRLQGKRLARAKVSDGAHVHGVRVLVKEFDSCAYKNGAIWLVT
jgi:hypothetical protein